LKVAACVSCRACDKRAELSGWLAACALEKITARLRFNMEGEAGKFCDRGSMHYRFGQAREKAGIANGDFQLRDIRARSDRSG